MHGLLRTAVSLLVLATALQAPQSARAACQEIGPGIASADTVVLNGVHPGWGQTFVASDSLLSQLVIWSQTKFPGCIAVAFANTDSTGTPILEAPSTLFAGPYPGGIDTLGAGPYPITFAFGSPIHLFPGRTYIFFVGYTCAPMASYLEAQRMPTLTAADAWQFKFAWFDFFQGIAGGPFDFALCHTLTFCDGSVPARSSTWGALKTRYH